jgi:hypothetical protein
LCLLARAWKCTPNVKRTRDLPESEGALSRDQYEVGDFFLLISSFAGLLVDYPRVMAVNPLIVVFRVVQFTLMLRLVSFGLKIRCHLVPMRP